MRSILGYARRLLTTVRTHKTAEKEQARNRAACRVPSEDDVGVGPTALNIEAYSLGNSVL